MDYCSCGLKQTYNQLLYICNISNFITYIVKNFKKERWMFIMDELIMDEFQPMGSDCDKIVCSTVPCGVGGQATVEYCYTPLASEPPRTHCGCGYF